ncbi:MAG: sorbosone dehydrogenase family protein [Cyclobacteriaceae bacterium]
MKVSIYFFFFLQALLISSCRNSTDRAVRSVEPTDSVSINPYTSALNLPEPNEKESAVRFSKVIGWPEGKSPLVPSGFEISRFASGIKSPRNIYVAPNGDIFVAFANTESKGLKKKIIDEISGRDESQHTQKSLNEIYLFRDANGDGKPEIQSPYLTGLKQPFGLLVLNDFFYVANTDGLWRYPYNQNEIKVSSQGEKVLELPAGGYNNHWTRNIIANEDGSKIYISVGSASNHAEHGINEETFRANILEINPDGTGKRIFARGLRNPVGMDILPGTNELWTVVNERDKLGDNLVPDYLTKVKENGFYGWPYSYFGQHPDPRITPEDQNPQLVEKAIVPDLPLDSHSSSMGLVFYDRETLPEKYRGGAFVTQHGSWNRSSFTGYRVAFVPFKGGKLAGPAEDFLTGFVANDEEGEVYGRPVSTAITDDGNLLITDDASDVIWFVKKRE